jgi:hypothetical protein
VVSMPLGANRTFILIVLHRRGALRRPSASAEPFATWPGHASQNVLAAVACLVIRINEPQAYPGGGPATPRGPVFVIATRRSPIYSPLRETVERAAGPSGDATELAADVVHAVARLVEVALDARELAADPGEVGGGRCRSAGWRVLQAGHPAVGLGLADEKIPDPGLQKVEVIPEHAVRSSAVTSTAVGSAARF